MLARHHYLGIALMSVLLVGADTAPRPAVQLIEGRIVTVTEIDQGRNGRIVVSEKIGNNRRVLPVPAMARVTLNQNSVTLGELQRDDRVVVAADSYAIATEISAVRNKKLRR